MPDSGKTLYLDAMASTPLDPRVAEAMAPFWSEMFGNPHSSDHAFGWQANAAVAEAAIRIARLIGADPDEIVFTSGATEANNLAILGLAHRAPRGRRRILVSAIEHKCTWPRRMRQQKGMGLSASDSGLIATAGLISTTSQQNWPTMFSAWLRWP
ncbi:MAG: aminotransferase class V-fold PLP-dependent enzyme [Rhizomicrobium sp.]